MWWLPSPAAGWRPHPVSRVAFRSPPKAVPTDGVIHRPPRCHLPVFKYCNFCRRARKVRRPVDFPASAGLSSAEIRGNQRNKGKRSNRRFCYPEVAIAAWINPKYVALEQTKGENSNASKIGTVKFLTVGDTVARHILTDISFAAHPRRSASILLGSLRGPLLLRLPSLPPGGVAEKEGWGFFPSKRSTGRPSVCVPAGGRKTGTNKAPTPSHSSWVRASQSK